MIHLVYVNSNFQEVPEGIIRFFGISPESIMEEIDKEIVAKILEQVK
jgi:hypothetical protein